MTDFETLLNRLGQCGRYQMLMYFACFVTIAIAGSSMNLTIVFYAATPDHWCRNPSVGHLNLTRDVLLNITIPKEYKSGEEVYSRCTKYDIDFTNWTQDYVEQALSEGRFWTKSLNVTGCEDGWQYDQSSIVNSIVTDWDLVCDHRVLADVAKSIYQFGFLVGVVIFSFISDWYGRRPAFISSLIMKIGCAIGLAFAPNFTAFIILRFLLGCAALGNYVVAFVLVTEMIGSQTRTRLSTMPSYMWSCTLMVMAGVAYLVREWRHLALAVSIPQLIMLPVCLFVPESPRWLYVHNQHARADAIIRKMAKMNGISLPEKLDVQIMKNESKGAFLDILRSPKLRWFTVILLFSWMETSLVYYFIAYYGFDFSNNIYINYLLGGTVETGATLIGQVIVHYVGRNTILTYSSIMTGISLLCIMVVPKDLIWLTMALSMLGRFFLKTHYTVKMTHATEVFPTSVRNVGLSACQGSSRIGGVIAPYVASLFQVNTYIPLTLVGAPCILAGMLHYLLPETKDKKMLETIAEAEQVYRFPKSNCCKSRGKRRKGIPEITDKSLKGFRLISPMETD